MYNDMYAHKVKQLEKMLEYERKQAANQQYGANLNHWSGCASPINLDADALQALIDHYCAKDEIEHYQATKANDGHLTVRELNRAQLDYLKQDLLTQRYIENGDCPSYGELAWAVDNITDEEVFESYADVEFTEDDFFP